MRVFALKTALVGSAPDTLTRPGCKTMYGGKTIAPGDRVYVFADEAQGGRGLVARGEAVAVEALPRPPSAVRWTPRVDLELRLDARAQRPLGRAALKGFTAWDDGAPETELNFKLFRQATPKLVGVTEAAAAFLDGFF